MLEQKYIVLKNEDIVKYLTSDMQIRLARMERRIERERKKDDKEINKYLVVNTDEPFINSLLAVMRDNGIVIR